MDLDWFDPSPEVVIRPEVNCRRVWQRRFGKEYIQISSTVILANKGGRIFELICKELDSIASPVYDYRDAGYVYYEYDAPKSGPVTVFRAPEPGPWAAALLEELIASGGRQFLLMNRTGSLRATVPVGSLVLPDELVREEGTSYHYAPPDVRLTTSRQLNQRIRDIASGLGIPLIDGKHWTTDAIYRETFAKVERLAGAGVVSVDMELSALAGVAYFRKCELSAVLVVSDVVARDHSWNGMTTPEFGLGVQRAAQIASRVFRFEESQSVSH